MATKAVKEPQGLVKIVQNSNEKQPSAMGISNKQYRDIVQSNLASIYADLSSFVQRNPVATVSGKPPIIVQKSNSNFQPVLITGHTNDVTRPNAKFQRLADLPQAPIRAFGVSRIAPQPMVIGVNPSGVGLANKLNDREATPEVVSPNRGFPDDRSHPADRHAAESDQDSVSTPLPELEYSTNEPEDYQSVPTIEEADQSRTDEGEQAKDADYSAKNEENDQQLYSSPAAEENILVTVSPNDDSESPEQPDTNDENQTDEATKEEGQQIDDEVDRMTQPSSGFVSRKDRPVEEVQVQFDDSPNSLSIQPGFDLKQVALDPSSQYKPYEDTQVGNDASRASLAKSELSKDRKRLDKFLVGSQEQNSSLSEILRRHIKQMSRPIERPALSMASEATNNKSFPLKRRSRATKIQAPYEFNKPLNRLVTESSSYNSRSLRLKRSSLPDIHAFNSTIVEVADLDQTSDDLKAKMTLDDVPLGQLLDSNSHNLTRRSDVSILPNFYYIMPNDTSSQSVLPLNEASGQSELIPVTGNSAQPSESAQSSKISNGSDHQPASSIFTVDQGILFYPPEAPRVDNFGYPSVSHKKSKKKKHKSKMSIGYKKGGHKNKKHKKEEKKYLKEKKFKGAKKGKKIKKGKGGQGGKKGKKKFKDKGYKKKGFKNVYHKEEFGQKKSYFDEFRDKDFKKKWKKFDDNYKYAQMKKWQAKDVKGAKKLKDHAKKHKEYDKSRWKKKFHKESKEHKSSKDGD